MSDASEVKRWETISIDTKIPGTMLDVDGVPRVTVVSASDHDRIVAELKAEVDKLKRSEFVNAVKAGHDYGDALDEISNLKQTIARQAKVIEKLKDVVTCVGCAVNESCPYAWDGYNTNGDCLAEK